MRTRQTGLSLVELMVGLALGLFVAATGLATVAEQWREHRQASAAMRLVQELRSAGDLIARDLRRAGHWAAPLAAAANPYAALAPQTAASDAASFAYSRDAVENQTLDGNEQFGLRLRRGVIEMLLGAGNWQALTDAGTLLVTEFVVQPRIERVSLLEHCERPCPPGARCEAAVEVRGLALRITARAADDPTLVRRLDSFVRLRNDVLRGACPA